MTVSIIIAVKGYCENLKECVSKCLELEAIDYEILIAPDEDFPKEGIFSKSNVKIIPTGGVTPPYKRDIAVKQAKGKIIAFLDDDTFPAKEWLKVSIKIFKKDDLIGCVCGPAVTPNSDSIKQKASGLIYSSILVAGNHAFRYIPKKQREVFDFPSCNFLIKKSLFEQVGGFDKPFWPGEDTFLCLKILETGKKIIYDPKVLVYHHRRTLFKEHLIQIENYAFHRGYFVKKYPKTSLRLEYFIPSFFILGLFAGAFLGLFFTWPRILYLGVFNIYLLFIIVNSILSVLNQKEPFSTRIKLLFFIIPGIVLTHLTYGLYFIKGLFARKMLEECIQSLPKAAG